MQLKSLGIILWICTLCFGVPAWAQNQELEQAKHNFDQGQGLYLQGRYLEAAEQFLAAYEARKFPAFLFNAAVCYEKNRDFQKALSFYKRYLDEDPHSQDRSLVLKRIEGIQKHLNPPTPTTMSTNPPPERPPEPPNLPPVDTKGMVVIESQPEGAAIYLEDKRKGIFTRTPYTGSLPPGAHTVIVELKGYKTETKTFFARHDRLVYLYFSLSLERTRGWIEVKANTPGAEVYVDTKKVGMVGRTPYSGWLRPGTHKIIVEKPGFAPFEKTLKISVEKVHVVEAQLEKVKYGWLKVTGKTTANARIKINGKPLFCTENPCRTELPPGKYTVELEKSGFKPYTHHVTIEKAIETQLAVRLNPKPSRLKAYITFGVSAALLAGAIATGVVSNNRRDSLQADLDQGRLYDSSDSRITEGKITSIVANSLYGLSGVVAALGVYYLFQKVGPDSFGETRTHRFAITPVFQPQVAGLAGNVRF